MLGRDRDKVKCATWGVYLRVEASKLAAVSKKLKEAAVETEAKIPGGPSAHLQFERKLKLRVEISRPWAVSEDTCVRLFEDYLGRPLGAPRVPPSGGVGGGTGG